MEKTIQELEEEIRLEKAKRAVVEQNKSAETKKNELKKELRTLKHPGLYKTISGTKEVLRGAGQGAKLGVSKTYEILKALKERRKKDLERRKKEFSMNRKLPQLNLSGLSKKQRKRILRQIRRDNLPVQKPYQQPIRPQPLPGIPNNIQAARGPREMSKSLNDYARNPFG